MVSRIGIVGFGWVARDYFWPALSVHPGAELRAVVSVRSSDFVGLPAGVATYGSVSEMLTDCPLDAVYIASPNHLHHDHAIACLEAGLHVLCEKPLARTYAEAAAMQRVAEATGCHLLTAYDQRYHPAHLAIRELIAEGELGTPTQCRIDYACWVPTGWSSDNWRVDPARAGGGAVIDLAPHGLDLLEWLLQDEINELHCFTQRAVHDYAVDDGGVLSARFRSGAVAALTVGYNRPESLPRRRLELTGTEGMLVATDTMGQTPGGRVYLHRAGSEGSKASVAFDRETGPFRGLVNAFVDDIRGERPMRRDAKIDLRLVRLLAGATAANISVWP